MVKSGNKMTVARLSVLAVVLSITACGSKPDDSGSRGAPSGSRPNPSSSQNAPLSNLLPSDIAPGSTLTVPSSLEFPPFEYRAKDNKTPLGLDVDIANAIGQKLGISFKFVDAKFETIIPSIMHKQYRLSLSGVTDTKERQAQVSFVDYFVDGIRVVVTSSNPANIIDWDDLCGKKVAVAQGDISIDAAKTQSDKCTAAGKDPLHTSILPDGPQCLLAVQSGRADATISDAAAAGYVIKTTANNTFKQVGELRYPAPYGIVVAKSDTEFQNALVAALESMLADGTYERILTNWNQDPASAIKDITVNRGTSYAK